MARKPNDLRLTQAEVDKATTIEALIDEKLDKAFVHGKRQYEVVIPSEVVIPAGLDSDDRIVNEIIRRYTAAPGGWSRVRYFTNQGKFVLDA